MVVGAVDILILVLTTASFKSATALVWLSINDKNTTTYNASNSETITIICHQQLNYEDRSWIHRNRSISRLVGTCPSTLNSSSCSEGSWNDTLTRNRSNGNILYFDNRRAVLSIQDQTSPKYCAIGYTIFAPVTEDSGVYRCRGTYTVGKRKIIEEISEPVNVFIRRAPQDTTAITVNFKSLSSLENTSPQPLNIRCHTFIPSNNATVVAQRIYKRQNLTRQDYYGALSSSMTSWTLIYDSGNTRRSITPFLNFVPTVRITGQDLTSGFDITHRGYGDTGYYYCSASCMKNGNVSFTVDSREVFLDSRRNPFITAAIMATNSPTIQRYCFYNDEEESVNFHLCKTFKNDSLTLSCSIFTRDFIPQFKVTIGAVEANDVKPYFYPSENEYEFDDSSPFQSIVFEGRVTKSFYAVEMCDHPQVACSAWFPESSDRYSERTVRLISDFCDNNEMQALSSHGSSENYHHKVSNIAVTAVAMSYLCLHGRH